MPAKKVNGRKRHLLTYTQGLPLRLTVHAGDIQDRDGVCVRVRRRSPWLRLLSADAGYQDEVAACAAAGQVLRLEIVRRPVGTDSFHLLPGAGSSRAPSPGSAATDGSPRNSSG